LGDGYDGRKSRGDVYNHCDPSTVNVKKMVLFPMPRSYIPRKGV
jgi:hypothetical protein